jgi:hypothetical protein
MSLNDNDDRELATRAGIDADVVALVRAQTEHEFATIQPGSDAFHGFSVAVKNGAEAESLMEAIVPRLATLRCKAFWSERREPDGMKDTDEVLILMTDDPYAAVRLRGTNGANYDVFTEDVIERLQGWRELCEFRVVGAARDWAAIQFDTLPDKICAFAEEVYLFCPDTVDQGVGLSREADEPDRFARARVLCPEVSQRIRKDERAALKALGDMDPAVAEQFRALMKSAAAFSTPVDMGVRLLAEEIRSTRYLHLWWD